MPLHGKATPNAAGGPHTSPGRFRDDGSWDGRADAYTGPLDALARSLVARRDTEGLTPKDMVRLTGGWQAAMPSSLDWEALDTPNHWHLAQTRTALEAFLKYGPNLRPGWQREGSPRMPTADEVQAIEQMEANW